jgi:hypothetical protein
MATQESRAPRRLRCRVGDRAFILRCSADPSAVGRVVTVETRCHRGNNDWVVRSEGQAFQFRKQFRDMTRARAPDSWLCPIRPDEPDKTKATTKKQGAQAQDPACAAFLANVAEGAHA